MQPSQTATAPRQAIDSLSPSAFALGLYIVLVLAVAVGMLRMLDGTLGYTLDDPFIHLALSERISLGHYGINLGETTAPSSSVLWPFLLVPAVGRTWHVWVPLGFNLLCGAATALVIGAAVGRLQWLPGTGLQRAACVLVLVLAGNLAGLPYTGMEHSPQVLVAAIAAYGILEAMQGRTVPLWCLAAAALGPSIRYELFAVVGALMIALAGQRRWGAVLGLFAVSLAIPVVYGAWLVSLGLPPLPNSVLAKSSVYGNEAGLAGRVQTLLGSLMRRLTRPQFLILPMTTVILALLTWHAAPPRRWPMLGALGALTLQALVGPFGDYRYEVYALLFGSMVVVGAMMTAPRWLRVLAALTLLVTAAYEARCVVYLPLSAQNIHDQQYQMHRFVADFWRKDVAVNDLGWVSYRINPDLYVLDLVGLASNETLRRKNKDAAWLEETLQRRDIRLAIVYPWWFQSIPETWVKVGALRLSGRRISAGGDEVTFFATKPDATEELQAKLRRFAEGLPPGVRLSLP